MNNYDFGILSPIDFESLVKDILEIKLGVSLERFKEGKDQGIDIRYSDNKQQKIVIQCKRISNWNTLKSELKGENKKIADGIKSGKLQLEKYILVTSLKLSATNKEDIIKIFGNLIKDTKDILGREDLNDLLGKKDYKEVEKRHFKLRMCSTNVLESILHKDSNNRNKKLAEDIKRIIPLYVNNPSVLEAMNILKNHNVLIIGGGPGVGKSTLARVLCAHLSQRYSIFDISYKIEDFDVFFDSDKKQIFFFDDFLGGTYLEENSDFNNIARIIETINGSKNKKIIITSRSHILSQGLNFNDKINRSIVDSEKYTLELGKYSKAIKAHILYNHIFYSQLDVSYIRNLIIDKNYKKILQHPSYTPRIIERISKKEKIEKDGVKPDGFIAYCLKSLNDPSELWKLSFEKLSDIEKDIIVFLFLFGGRIKTSYLINNIFDKHDKKKMELYLKSIEGTFITVYGGYTFIENPSIIDFLLNYLEEDYLLKVLNMIDIFDVRISNNLKAISQKRDMGQLKKIIESKLKTNSIYSCKKYGTLSNLKIFDMIYKYFSGKDREKYFDISLTEIYQYSDTSTLLMIFDLIKKKSIDNLLNNVCNNITSNDSLLYLSEIKEMDSIYYLEWIQDNLDIDGIKNDIGIKIEDVSTESEIEDYVDFIKNTEDMLNIDLSKERNLLKERKEMIEEEIYDREDYEDQQEKEQNEEKYIEDMFNSLA